MNEIHRNKAIHGRMPILAVLVTTLLTVALAAPDPTYTQANSQEPTRLVVKKPWRIEPVRVVSVRTKKKGNIEVGSPFTDDDDWLDGFTVTVFNGSDKVVTAVAVSLIFPRPPGDLRNKFAYDLYFGVSPIRPEYTRRDPKKVIKPAESAQLEVGPQMYTRVKAALQRQGYPESINRIELTVLEVGFEDGTVLLSGTLYLQEPNNPNRPY